MSASSFPRVGRSPKGFRVIRRVHLAPAAPKSGPKLGLWQRLCAAFHLTPQQWHAWQMWRQAAPGGDGLRAVVLSGAHSTLISAPPPATSPRRFSQAELP